MGDVSNAMTLQCSRLLDAHGNGNDFSLRDNLRAGESKER
jgi:hypothetical protein